MECWLHPHMKICYIQISGLKRLWRAALAEQTFFDAKLGPHCFSVAKGEK